MLQFFSSNKNSMLLARSVCALRLIQAPIQIEKSLRTIFAIAIVCFRAKFKFACSEKKQILLHPANAPVHLLARNVCALPLQIEKSLQLFHPIDNALTPRILNSAGFSFPTDDNSRSFMFWARCGRSEESLNKQLKSGSHPSDRMSTGEGAETWRCHGDLGPTIGGDFLCQKIMVPGFCTRYERQNS